MIVVNNKTVTPSWIFPKFEISFNYGLHMLPSEGWLAWEYNPFYNLRLTEDSVKSGSIMHSISSLVSRWHEWWYDIGTGGNHEYVQAKDLPDIDDYATYEDLNKVYKFAGYVDPYTEVFYQKGSLMDFDTDKFQFSLNNPVQIECQHSYDGSVNLILNDNYNYPMLINSRFTVMDGSRYRIIDRYGNNDTNIYDEHNIYADTALFCGYRGFPEISVIEIKEGGNLKCGSYTFYFWFCNADGDHTDIVAQTRNVYISFGANARPYDIRSGYCDENTHKQVLLSIDNKENNYDYVEIFYSRTSSDEFGAIVETINKVDHKYPMTTEAIVVTGNEPTHIVDDQQINERMLLFRRAKTECQAGGRLFMANLTRTDIPYDKLTDLSLRLLPTPVYHKSSDLIGELTDTYDPIGGAMYFDYNNQQKYVGYFPEEYYRFAVMYVLHDGTYTCAFPLRGAIGIPEDADDPTKAKGSRYNTNDLYDFDSAIDYSEDDYLLNDSSLQYENAKGVCSFNRPGEQYGGLPIIGVRIKVPRVWIDQVRKYAKGFMFVRQKRIPLLLCQGIGIGVESNTGAPMIKSSSYTDTAGEYICESFIDTGGNLDASFTNRLKDVRTSTTIKDNGMIVPEIFLSSNYLREYIDSNELVLRESWNKVGDDDGFKETASAGFFSISQDRYAYNPTNIQTTSKLYCIDSLDQISIASDGRKFCHMQGIESDATMFGSVGTDINTAKYKGKDLVLRGEYGPFVGSEKQLYANTIYNIYVPGYSESNINNYYSTRIYDKNPYYSISNFYDILNWIPDVYSSDSSDDYTDYELFSGDCFICQVTFRMLRNFQDSANQFNDVLVDNDTWKNYWNYNSSNDTSFLDSLKQIGTSIIGAVTGKEEDTDPGTTINKGDVNAVKLGHWVTFTIYSSINLLRTTNISNVEEDSIFGGPRTFYPYSGISRSGRFKRDESMIVNMGCQKTLSKLLYFERPDVPYIKDIFETRISYSRRNATEGTSNKYRYFMPGCYRDYPITHGGITRIVSYRGGIVVVFEHGIGFAKVDETVQMSNDTVIRTGDVLPESLDMISDTYGSQWTDSVIVTGDGSSSDPGCVYGVDTVSRAIWMYDGNRFTILSAIHIEPFLNKSITLTEREHTPVIGIRNVKTHYVHYKKDVLFTFYDDLSGFEETAWNLCYNETINNFITFYSWMPSYSGNIDLMYFSFNRMVSKWTSKLWYTLDNDYIFAEKVILTDDVPSTILHPSIMHLNDSIVTTELYDNRKIPVQLDKDDPNLEQILKEASEEGKMYCNVTLSLSRDALGNYLQFIEPEDITGEDTDFDLELHDGILEWKGYWNETKKDWNRDKDGKLEAQPIPKDKVYLLNIKCDVEYLYYKSDVSLKDVVSSAGRYMTINAGYFEQTLAFCHDDCVNGYSIHKKDEEGNGYLDYHYPLATDFWKHGNAGLLNICSKLKPAFWYDKQHPFEFEVVVTNGLNTSFNNLVLSSNEVEPESFHYSIDGNAYSFSCDYHNMYFRQEAVRNLYKYNYHDVLCDNKYHETPVSQRMLPYRPNYPVADRSVLFPLFYNRVDTYNEIEDSYQRLTGDSRNYQCLSGTEVTYDPVADKYNLTSHVKANPFNSWYKQDLTKDTAYTPAYKNSSYVSYKIDGIEMEEPVSSFVYDHAMYDIKYFIWLQTNRLRGNCYFKDGIWNIQIPSIVCYHINETVWTRLGGNFNHPILNLALNPTPSEPYLDRDKIAIPKELLNLHYSKKNGSIIYDQNWLKNRTEVRIQGPWMKVKVRYKGDKLALINYLTTIYN